MIKSRISRIPARRFATQFFVPKHDVARSEDVEKIRNFLRDKPRILVVTGAGISTESGFVIDFTFKYLRLMLRLRLQEFQITDPRVSGSTSAPITSRSNTQNS